MKKFGAFEAKTHFSEILGKVMNGERCVITKHGIKVAMIVPFSENDKKEDPIGDTIRGLKKSRKGINLGKKMSIKEMREEGRK